MYVMKAHPLLSQVPLIVSPSLRPPQAVTLPYNYHKLPSSMPAEAGNLETLEQIITDSSGFLDALDSKHTERQEAYASWKKQVLQQEIQEKRRIAPGYLDTSDRILQPLRESPTDKKDDATENELDKAFGRVSLD